MNRNRLLRRSGKRYEGIACICTDRSVVNFPGHYAVNKHGNVDASTPLRWVEEVPEDPDDHGGWYEYL
jgi:hypothetical protein